MDFTIINLTPHAVRVYDAEGNIKRTYASKGIARAAQHSKHIGEIDGVELVEVEFGEPFGLPDPAPSTFLIVSAITADAARKSGRSTDDLLLPTDLVRDSEGQIIGCYRLAIYNYQSKGGFG